MAQKLEKVEGEKFLYQHTMSKVYYIRIRTETEDTERSLNTTKKQMAVKLRDKWMAARTTEKFGIEEPKPAPKRLRIDQAMDDYKKAGFASIRRGKLTHPGIKHLRTEQDAIPTLKGFFKTKHVDELAPDLLDEYRTWREKNVTKGDGAKTTDLELNTLSKSLDWAVRKGRLVSNPIKARARYYNPSKARHCKELAASNPPAARGIRCRPRIRLMRVILLSPVFDWEATGSAENRRASPKLSALTKAAPYDFGPVPQTSEQCAFVRNWRQVQ